MEKFEIHITGTKNIISVLNELKTKSIHIELKNPKNETIGVEYMSSFVKEFENYKNCKKWVDSFILELQSKNVEIYRVKIECPYFYKHYIKQSIYLEVHFPTNDFNKQYPFSYNVKSNKYVSTERTYLKAEYNKIISKWENTSNSEIELCLYDNNIEHDIYWMETFIKKYRTPSFDEMVIGFKCQTCYTMFADDEEWVDIEFTQDFYDKYISLIKSDAYKTEFRVLLE
jgi:hypothetical protein